MANFALYAYEFKPVYHAPEFDFPDWDKIDADESFQKRDEILKSIISLEQFKFNKGEYGHRLYIRKGDVSVLRLANNSKLLGEKDFTKFEMPNHPSCHIIIDHHKESQHIAIQEYRKAFTSSSCVVNILEQTLNSYLINYKLQIKIFPKTHTSGFWQLVGNYPMGISKVRFIFPYPNMGRVAALAGDLMKTLSMVTNGDAIAESHSRGIEALQLDQDNETIQDWVAATSAAGSAELLPKGKKKWIAVDKEFKVVQEMPLKEIKRFSDKDLFDQTYEYTSTWLHQIKLVYE